MIASQRKDNTMRITLLKSDEWERVVDTDTGEVLAENHVISIEDLLRVLDKKGVLFEVQIKEVSEEELL
jgi:hypothetical protein